MPQVCLDLFASQYALEMVNLLTRIDERLNEEKQKISALDFDDLEVRTLALLQSARSVDARNRALRFFLVDEFQDTNGMQRELLERLALSKGRQAGEPFHRRRSQAVDLRFSRRRRRCVSPDDVNAARGRR